MRIKRGDNVVMLAGKDRGKQGKIIDIKSESGRVVVSGLNLVKKNVRPKKQGEKGQIIDIPRAVDVSNIMLFCSGCKKPSRLGVRFEGDKKVRFCKKCQRTV